MTAELLTSVSEPTVIASVAVGSAIAYKMWRILKADHRADKADAITDGLRDDLTAQVKSLTERCDMFAQERNKAIENAAILQGEVRLLSGRVVDLIAKIEELKADLQGEKTSAKDLSLQNAHLRGHVRALKEALATLADGSKAVEVLPLLNGPQPAP